MHLDRRRASLASRKRHLKTTRVDRVRESLADDILSGRLESGARLDEVSLARRFGVSRTPIQPVLIGDSTRALAVSARLEDAGFFVPAIRPPTVPVGQARLRVALSALHAESDVERLLDALANCLR